MRVICLAVQVFSVTSSPVTVPCSVTRTQAAVRAPHMAIASRKGYGQASR